METRHPTFLGAEGRQGWGTPVGQPQMTSQAAGTWLGWDIPGCSAWGETQGCRLLPQQRDSPAPSLSHPTVSLLIKSVQLAELGEKKLLLCEAAPQKEVTPVQHLRKAIPSSQ